MSSAEKRSKLKERFLLSGQSRIIPSSDDKWWSPLYILPQNVGEINEVFNGQDIKSMRDSNKINFVMLIRFLGNKIVDDVHSGTISIERTTAMRELLNKIRILTRLIPFLYELPEYFDELETIIFWSTDFNSSELLRKERLVLNESSRNSDYLGVGLIESLFSMLHIKGFSDTFHGTQANEQKFEELRQKDSNAESLIESDRSEVLKLILTLCLTSFYERPNKITNRGSTFLTFIVSKIDRRSLSVFMEFLLRTTCRYCLSLMTQESGTEDQMCIIDLKYHYTTYIVELLTIMVVYPVPGKEADNLKNISTLNTKSNNYARQHVARINSESELLYIASSFMNILKQPMRDNDKRHFLGRQISRPSLWALEITMLLWEMIQCNRNFKTIISKVYLDEIFIVQLFYVLTYYNVSSHKNLVRICSYFMLYLSSGTLSLEKLFDHIKNSFYETLPSNLKLNIKTATIRDYFVIHVSQFLISLPEENNIVSSLLLTTLVETIYNLIPIVSERGLAESNDASKRFGNSNYRGGIGYTCCVSINQLVGKFSTRSFILRDKSHSDLLALLIRAVCASITKNPIPSRMLLLSILKNEKSYHSLKSTIYNLTSEYFDEAGLLKFQDQHEVETEVITNHYSETIDHAFNVNGHIMAPGNESQYVDFTSIEDCLNKEESEDDASGISFNTTYLEEDTICSFLIPELPTGMSKRSREKLPMESPLKRSWGGNDSLRIILDIIIPNIKLSLKDKLTVNEVKSLDGLELLHHIQNVDFKKIISENKSLISFDFLPETSLETLKFSWSHLSLGWYISLLYSELYNSFDRIESYLGNKGVMKNVSSTFSSLGKLTYGWGMSKSQTKGNSAIEWVSSRQPYISHWAFTNIKLFKVSDSSDGFMSSINKLNSIAVPGTPTSMNDMANNLVRRFSDFRMNSSGRNSIISNGNDDQDGISIHPRNSVTSLRSINSSLKSRQGTPRNSFST